MTPDAQPQRAARQPSRMWVPYLVLAGSLLLTAVAAYYVAANAEAHDRLGFETAVRRTTGDIQRRLDAHVALLRAGAGLFASQDEVTRAEFQAFVGRLDLPNSYPGVRGIGFSRRVPAAELEAVAAGMRQEGFDDFAVKPAGAREEYFPIVYGEPLDARSRGALGFDMFSEPVRREALERARDTAAPAATGRVTLVQESETNRQAGFVIYVPVYRGGAIPATIEERRANLAGFVYSPFRADDLLNNIFRHEPSPLVALRVYDGKVAAPENLLHTSEGAGGASRASSRTCRLKSRSATGCSPTRRAPTPRSRPRRAASCSSSWAGCSSASRSSSSRAHRPARAAPPS